MVRQVGTPSADSFQVTPIEALRAAPGGGRLQPAPPEGRRPAARRLADRYHSDNGCPV